MTTRRIRGLGMLLTIVGFVVVSSTARAQQNTTPAKAVSIPTDGSTKGGFVSGSAGGYPQAWYVARLFGGRSYSIQATESDIAGTANSGSIRSGFILVSLFGSDGASTPPGAQTFTADAEPAVRHWPLSTLADQGQGSYRYSYTPAAAANATEYLFVKAYPWVLSNASDYAYFAISAIDTTQYCPWYFTSGDFESFTEVHNTSSQNVNFTMTFYSLPTTSGGAISPVGTPYSFTLVPFATTLVTAKTGGGVPAGNMGGARITHNGVPGAIKANITTLNTTGVGLTHSFNVACGSRDSSSISGVDY